LPESFGGPRALSTKSTSIVIYRPGDRTFKTDDLSRDVLPQPMARLTDEQRRALRLLAGSPNGCTEAILMAHGFHLAMLGKLAFDGFANVEARETMAGSRLMKVFWLQITEAGRKAIG
jgi:hypothetical protein